MYCYSYNTNVIVMLLMVGCNYHTLNISELPPAKYPMFNLNSVYYVTYVWGAREDTITHHRGNAVLSPGNHSRVDERRSRSRTETVTRSSSLRGSGRRDYSIMHAGWLGMQAQPLAACAQSKSSCHSHTNVCARIESRSQPLLTGNETLTRHEWGVEGALGGYCL